jgi:hypothetical protein
MSGSPPLASSFKRILSNYILLFSYSVKSIVRGLFSFGILTRESLSSLVAAFSWGFKFTNRPVPEMSSVYDFITGVVFLEPIETIDRLLTTNGFILAFEPSFLKKVCPGWNEAYP